MKTFSMHLSLYCASVLLCSFSGVIGTDQPSNSSLIGHILANEHHISQQEYHCIINNPTTVFVYIPQQVKRSIKKIAEKYHNFDNVLYPFVTASVHVAPYAEVACGLQQVLDVCAYIHTKSHGINDVDVQIVRDYADVLASGDACIRVENFGDDFGADEADAGQFRLVVNCIRTCKLTVVGPTQLDGNLTVTGDVTLSKLDIGVMSVNNLHVVETHTTVNHAVQIGNAVGRLSSITTGTNGQVLIGATGADPAFATLTSTGGTISFTAGPNSLNLEAVTTFSGAIPFFGNVVRVDKVYGNDATGARNGLPFLTITAALAAAQSGDECWIFPGTYNESFTIPTGVSVHGLDRKNVIISRSVTTATDLITMGTNTSLESVTLSLTSAMHVQLRGIVFPGTTSATARVADVALTVDNSTAGAGSSNVYGVHSSGTGQPTNDFTAVQATTIVVTSTGSGASVGKRGILIDAANKFNVRDSNITVTTGGGNSAIGVETSHASASLTIRTSTVSGTNSGPGIGADISRTAGTLLVATTDLLNANANGIGFTTDIAPAQIQWADIDNFGAGQMRVGTQAIGNMGDAKQFIRVPQAMVAKDLGIQLAVAGASGTDTYRLYKNDVSTLLSVSLTGPALSNINTGTSVSFAAGDRMSMVLETKGSTMSARSPVVNVDLY